MKIPLRRIASFVGVASLPFALGGCVNIVSILICLLAAARVEESQQVEVVIECGAFFDWTTFHALPGTADGDTLAVRAKQYTSAFSSGPTIWHSGPITATIDVTVDRESDLLTGYNRQFLRIEDDANPGHFAALFATAGPSDGFTVTMENESGLLDGSMFFATADAVRLMIVRDETGYHGSAAPIDGSFSAIDDCADAAPSARVRVRFGADQMSPGARFEFHQLDLSADAFGDENTAPIIDELGSALDDLNAAALEAQNGTPDFVSIAGSIDSAKGTLGHAKALIAAAKRDHDLDKSNQPKLAIKALKKGLKRAKQGESIADLLADGNGSAAKLDKRISDATLQAQLALANLLGVKTKSARKIAEHIVVGP